MERQRVSLREIHGIVFGTLGKPTHVIVPGFADSQPERFAAWLDQLRSDGWEVTLTPALSFEGVLVDARLVSPR
jgi:exopolysaccharide biosynthesis predicted pyruvyltransferase EpsI